MNDDRARIADLEQRLAVAVEALQSIRPGVKAAGYSGGHRGAELMAFRHGMETVLKMVDARLSRIAGKDGGE